MAPYADSYFQYDDQNRGSREVVQGAGSSSSTNPLGVGLGAFTYSYTTSGNSAGFNSWQTKTTETLPDGNTNTIYTNAYGEVMLSVSQSGSQSWGNFTEYDQNSLYDGGRIILQANPSALTGHDDAQADLMNNLADSQGLITLTTYGGSTTAGPTTPGDVKGYVKEVDLEQGKLGTPTGTTIEQSSTTYIQHSARTDTATPVTVTKVASQTVYSNTDGTGAGDRLQLRLVRRPPGQPDHHSQRAAVPGNGRAARGIPRGERPRHGGRLLPGLRSLR